MALTKKIWCPDEEPMPAGLFNELAGSETPANWFREEPSIAAELYALERCVGRGKRCSVCSRLKQPLFFTVHVLDDDNVLYRFKVTVQDGLVHAHVTKL